jgi:hypothetical protein
MQGATDMNTPQGPSPETRRRNIRRTTIVLVAVAVGIYVAFIVSSVLKAS